MSIRRTVSIDDVISFLNELFAIDADMVTSMIVNRTPCNQAMANHPSVQVWEWEGETKVGLIGILNGLFGCDNDGTGPIATVFNGERLVSITHSDAISG